MKILVTGGAGFIASHIVDGYIREGHSVIVVDDLSSGKKNFINPKAVFYEADVKNRKVIDEIFKKEKPETLNHHAAQISVRNSVADPIFDASTNIIGLLNLLEAGVKNGLKKVILASSGGVVYGDAGILPTPEDYNPKQPLSPYGVAKLTSENYLYCYSKSYNLTYVALRYSNVYGPRQNPYGEAGVVAIFSLKLIESKQTVINGDGKQTRDYIYVEDVVKANLSALDCHYIGPVNIGTSIETDVNKLFENMLEVAGVHASAAHGPSKKGEQMRSSLNINLAKQVLGWQPQISLPDGLKLTYQYFKNNGKQ